MENGKHTKKMRSDQVKFLTAILPGFDPTFDPFLELGCGLQKTCIRSIWNSGRRCFPWTDLWKWNSSFDMWTNSVLHDQYKISQGSMDQFPSFFKSVWQVSFDWGRVCRSLKSALYGRTSKTPCGDVNSNCKKTLDVTEFAKKECNNRHHCQLQPTNEWGDPCPNVYKYMDVYFECVESTCFTPLLDSSGKKGQGSTNYWSAERDYSLGLCPQSPGR